jgi:hypothetical protein
MNGPGMVSVVDGIIITVLQGLLIMPVMVELGSLESTTIRTTYILTHILYCVFGMVLWAKIRTFGVPPGCDINNTAKFVIYGINFKAVSVANQVLNELILGGLLLGGLIITIFMVFSEKPIKLLPGHRKSIFFVAIFAWLSFIISCELTLQRNGLLHTANAWTYGQTLSLVLVANSITEFIYTLNEPHTKEYSVSEEFICVSTHKLTFLIFPECAR